MILLLRLLVKAAFSLVSLNAAASTVNYSNGSGPARILLGVNAGGPMQMILNYNGYLHSCVRTRSSQRLLQFQKWRHNRDPNAQNAGLL